jgi:hypothetical protein
MNMSPKDGWTASPDRTWTLAGEAKDPVLIYSLSGENITLAQTLPGKQYEALWFDPRTGSAQQIQNASTTQNTVFTKPDAQPWLLLFKPKS